MKVASTVRRGDKGSYGSACPTLRCSGQNAVRICCCKRESKHSTVNWVQYSSDGIRICRSKSWLKRPNPQHLHALHHLRHSFAVGTLLRWYREGINPAERLLHLSTFLGHVDPSSTVVYLTITAELLQEASDRFARFAAPLLTEVHACPRQP